MSKIKLTLTIIGIYVFWLCLFPLFLTETVKFSCEKFSNKSEYNIQIINPKVKFSILPTGSITADDIKLSSKDNSILLDVKKPKIKLRLLPLLSGRAHINSLKIEKINLTVNLIEDLKLDKDFIIKFKNRPFRFDSITIGEFSALFYKNNLKDPIKYIGKDFIFQRKNKYIKLQNNSTLDVSGNISKVRSNLYLPKNNNLNQTIFDIEFSNLHLSPLKNYFQHYLPKDLVELRGLIDIHANKDFLITEMTNCNIIMKDSAKSIHFPEKMYIKSKFNIKHNVIDFEEIDINSKNIDVAIKGKLKDYLGKISPTADFNIIINKSKVEDFINMLPAFKVEEIDTYKLKKYKFYGDILANFSIKGKLPEPDIFGDFYIDNGILTKPIPNTTKGANIKLHFGGKNVNFDVTVPAGGTERVWVKGSQEIYNIKYAELTVKSTQNVNLKSAQNVVNPLHEILNFIIGPVPILDINGLGNIDILVKGNRKKPHVWGAFNIKDATVFFLEAPDLIVTDAEASLLFNDQNTIFTTNKGIVNNKDFSIKGSCDLSGNFDFDVSSKDQPVDKLYTAAITATIFPEIQKNIPPLEYIKGLLDFNLKLYGSIVDFDNIKLNENIFVKGKTNLKNGIIRIKNIELNSINGNANIDAKNINANIKAELGKLPLIVNTKIKNDLINAYIDIPKLNLNYLISDKETQKKLYLPNISLKGDLKGSIDLNQLDNINLKANILGSENNSRIQYYPKGIITITNNKIVLKEINGYINNPQNNFDVNLVINNAFNKKPDVNGNVKLKTPDLILINDILTSEIIPENLKKYFKDYKFEKGALDLNAKISNSKINLLTDLAGISFIYKPLEIPVDIINGTLGIKNNILKLNKINILADNMPVLVDGDIKDYLGKQNFNLYFNSKPQQDFIDKYINKNQVYPIKIKGDIVYWVKIKGFADNFDLKTKIDMSKESSFYHFGATIGDHENAITVSLDTKVQNKINHRIREFSYDKIIDSLSGKQTKLNLLKAFGDVKILNNDLIFDNLYIKTNHPTDARIFNIIFRKPNIKEGQFTSDLRLNGNLSDLKILGDFHIFETNIPFLDTTMKNIELSFKDRTIDFSSKGEILGNDIIFNGVMKNKLTRPYRIEKAYFYTKNLDLNNIINKIKIAEVDEAGTFDSLESFDISSIITKNFKLKADTIELRNLKATEFEADTSLSEKSVFNVNNFKFNIAQGILNGKYSYNLDNSNMTINLDAENINANDITLALFDLNNQIDGDLTGTINLACKGGDFNSCMSTLSGNTIFNVKNGKMPKLGSLEYLLKAGNLLKSGFTGISINSVIDLLAPSKTGEFSDIFGSVNIKDGVARNIEITTKGKDLNLFVSGTYNFATSIADMEVLGLLSRKISTILGPIGNVSINTLFNVIPGVDLSKDSSTLEKINKIPGIELSEKAYRKFIAEIKGNINGDDYVTSFKWIN